MRYLLKQLQQIAPENFFLSAALTFGLFFLFITPPFQVPDEPNHFFRAWQTSEGTFKSIRLDQRVGGYLPPSISIFLSPYQRITWAKNTTSRIVRPEEVDFLENENKRRFFDFGNIALYSPLCYVPQSFGICIARIFTARLKLIFFAGRVSGFLAWVILIYFAISCVPIFKWLFTFLALLPMSLFVNMSYSADLMTNAICFLFLAYILMLCFHPVFITKTQLFVLGLLIVMLTAMKIVYSPMLFLLLLLPKKIFSSSKKHLLFLAGFFALGIISAFLWSYQISELYIPYSQYNKTFRETAGISQVADVSQQLNFLIADWTRPFLIVYRSVVDCWVVHVSGYIGTFGWLDTPLSPWFVYPVYVFIFLIAAAEKNILIKIDLKQRALILLVFSLIVSLVFISQHLSWVYVGAPSVLHIQGRYFIPFYPLLFVVFYGAFNGKKIIVPLVVVVTLLGLLYSCVVLYSRYEEPVLWLQ